MNGVTLTHAHFFQTADTDKLEVSLVRNYVNKNGITVCYYYISTVNVITVYTNLHFALVVINILLLIGNIHPHPGPSINTQRQHGPLNIVHVNVCSLLPKLDLIEVELSEYDIIMISETHLSGDIKTEDIQLKGFQKPIRKDRNRHGGGVAIYVKSSLHIRERPDLYNIDLEIIWLEVSTTTSSKIMIGVMYRPPNSHVSYWQALENNLQPIIDLNVPIFSGW